MSICYTYGVASLLPDASRKEKEKLIYSMIEVLGSNYFYEKLDGKFYRCGKKNNKAYIEEVSAIYSKKLEEKWMKYSGDMWASTAAGLGLGNFLLPKYKKYTGCISLNGESHPVSSSLHISCLCNTFRMDIEEKKNRIKKMNRNIFVALYYDFLRIIGVIKEKRQKRLNDIDSCELEVYKLFEAECENAHLYRFIIVIY